jgi:hypothetical protein
MLNTAQPATILEQASVDQLNDKIHSFHAMGESMAGMIKFFRGNAGWKGYLQIPFREHCHFSAPRFLLTSRSYRSANASAMAFG